MWSGPKGKYFVFIICYVFFIQKIYYLQTANRLSVGVDGWASSKGLFLKWRAYHWITNRDRLGIFSNQIQICPRQCRALPYTTTSGASAPRPKHSTCLFSLQEVYDLRTMMQAACDGQEMTGIAVKIRIRFCYLKLNMARDLFCNFCSSVEAT